LIYGDVLGKVINNYFDIPINKMVFSDEYWMSKPNLGIFKTHNISLDYHIGDNDITDGACEKLNIKYINIKNNYESLQTLM
jgi:FMN phosphatase YigB (HAD superfamily)